MTTLALDQTLASVVTATPGSARVLESFGLDYCCGGARRLDEACAEAGTDPAAVLDALAAIESGPPPEWARMGPDQMVDHLEATHHAYLHVEFDRLSALADKVAAVHGERHPELAQVRGTYEELRADLEPHLMKEERVLFPMIRELAGDDAPTAFHCGSLRDGPIAQMMAEHDRAGDLLADLRRLTDGYRVPDDGCASYQALYEGLALSLIHI